MASIKVCCLCGLVHIFTASTLAVYIVLAVWYSFCTNLRPNFSLDMCRVLALLLNGTITYFPEPADPFTEVGTVATHSCDEGFGLEGTVTRTCQSGTAYDGSAPTCERENTVYSSRVLPVRLIWGW